MCSQRSVNGWHADMQLGGMTRSCNLLRVNHSKPDYAVDATSELGPFWAPP
jgi:hypothetical protein